MMNNELKQKPAHEQGRRRLKGNNPPLLTRGLLPDSILYHSAFIIFLLVRSFQFLRDKRYYNVFSFTRN